MNLKIRAQIDTKITNLKHVFRFKFFLSTFKWYENHWIKRSTFELYLIHCIIKLTFTLKNCQCQFFFFLFVEFFLTTLFTSMNVYISFKMFFENVYERLKFFFMLTKFDSIFNLKFQTQFEKKKFDYIIVDIIANNVKKNNQTNIIQRIFVKKWHDFSRKNFEIDKKFQTIYFSFHRQIKINKNHHFKMMLTNNFFAKEKTSIFKITLIIVTKRKNIQF